MSQTQLPKVLCIDDELSILEALQRTLHNRFEVHTAQTPEQAEELIKTCPDMAVVICDQNIGSHKGLNVLKKWRKERPLTSRVLLSGEINLKSLEMAINDNIIHKFVSKPWENDHMLIQVVEALGIHRNLVENAQLKKLSVTDPITQLTNHRFFQEKLRLEWEKHKKKQTPLSLIMIDIDHFKKFNDRFGHPEGDKCLAHVADCLVNSLPANTSISRYGGEEFSVILPNCTSPEALILGESVRQQVLNSSFQNFPLSISLGIATSPEHANSLDELILSADQSLFQAKRRGRNQTVVGLAGGL